MRTEGFSVAWASFMEASGLVNCNFDQENITINVPLFKKLRDIIFFWWDNHFMSHFEQGFGSGSVSVLDPYSIGPLDPDPDP